MKIVSKGLILLSFLVATGTYAQDWVKMMNDPKVNVHDVQAAFYKWQEAHKADVVKTDEGNKEGEEQGAELFKRWEYFMVPRSFPSGNRPDQAANAKAYHEYLNSLNKNTSTDRVASAAKWVYAGNTNVPTAGGSGQNGDGRINRLEFYPGNTNIIYACSPAGGLWKTINGGATWSTNTDQLEALAIADIAINPLKPSIMYLATGDNDGIRSGYTPSTIGVLRSADGGNTWNNTGLSYTIQASGPGNVSMNKVVINPHDTNYLYASGSTGFYYSNDGGNNWTQSVTNDNIMDIEFEPSHGSTIYLGSTGGNFYRSVDWGKTFTNVTNGLPTGGAMGRLAIGVSAKDSNTVYLLCVDASTNGFYGVYHSKDRGQTFTPRSLYSNGAPNLLGWSSTGSDNSGQAFYNLAILVSPTDTAAIYVAGSYLWTSTDGGITWTYSNSFSGSVHVDIHDMLFYPGSSSSFLLCSDGGVYKTTDGGGTWSNLSNNLEIAEQYSIGLSGDNPELSISGWQDNNVNISGPTWRSTYGGDGTTCFIDYSNDKNMFAEAEYGSLGFSNDAGTSWNYINYGITEYGSWNTPWLQDPQKPNTIFAGFQNVWTSDDQGANWTQLSTWGAYYINKIAIAPSADKYIYASETYDLQATSDGGTTWNSISAGLPIGIVSMSDVTVERFTPTHLWVTFSGWDPSNKVFESTNGGATWTNISSGLPNLPVNCIITQPITDGIYVGTDIGVYYKDKTTGGWIPYNTNLPNVIITDLKLYKDDTLQAATFGRGTWKTPTYSYVNAGINNLSEAKTNSVNVYPNPTNGNVQVAFDAPAGEYNLSVVNILGQSVFSDNIKTTGSYKGEINLSDYGKGIYILYVNGTNTKIEKKIVVY